mmetsp:Transcript_23479/g.73637  ORF Transcript_23479/g.73637 Transcript_23479/m.73637 type:complete len:218 (+) Transcript_23479:728-1381(+)
MARVPMHGCRGHPRLCLHREHAGWPRRPHRRGDCDKILLGEGDPRSLRLGSQCGNGGVCAQGGLRVAAPCGCDHRRAHPRGELSDLCDPLHRGFTQPHAIQEPAKEPRRSERDSSRGRRPHAKREDESRVHVGTGVGTRPRHLQPPPESRPRPDCPARSRRAVPRRGRLHVGGAKRVLLFHGIPRRPDEAEPPPRVKQGRGATKEGRSRRAHPRAAQ